MKRFGQVMQKPTAARTGIGVVPLPRVSVVIPCYNYGRFLEACCASVLAQEGVDVDVTIFDDASSDDTVEIATRLMADDPRIALVTHSHNLGHIKTFNEALSSATAPFVVKMDADDQLAPGALMRATAVLEAHPSVSFVYGRVETFGEQVPGNLADVVRSWSVWSGSSWLIRRARRGHNVIVQPEVVMRRSALERVGGHREEIPESSDFNLWLRLASVGSVARVNGPVQGLYRVHEHSMRSTIHSGHLLDLRGRVRAFDLFFQECGPRLANGAELEEISRRALALDALRLGRRLQDEDSESDENVDDYLALALELCPSLAGTRQWRAAERAGSLNQPVIVARASKAARALSRDLAWRVRWRLWRRYGR